MAIILNMISMFYLFFRSKFVLRSDGGLKISYFDLYAFNESLFEFHEKKSEDADLEQNFSNLQSHILECINKYAPLRKRTRKEKKFASKPWISECIQISIDNKNNLYQYLQKNDRPDLKQKYNKMKKTLQKTLIAAETKFYDHQFVRCQNNSRKTWRLINEITCRKKRDMLQYMLSRQQVAPFLVTQKQWQTL